MLILNVHPKYDCAAAGILLTENINEFTEHECYHIIGEETFLKHKSQLIIGRDDKKIQELAERADIIHLNKYDWSANTQLGFIEPYLESKTSIFHLHGNMDIWKPLTDPLNPINRAKKYNMKIVSCSPLTEKITDCEWMPNPVPTHAKEYLPVHKSWHRPLKIIHTVINKYNKGTEEIKEVLDYLKQKGQIDIEYQVLEGECSLEETLKTKQQHHVCIDNLTQGFIGMAG